MEKEILTQFIEAYKSNVCLWDATSVDYTNRHKRQAAYEELLHIFKEIDSNATIDTTRKKIEILRNSYRRERKKVENSIKSGDSSYDDIYIPTLWYYQLLDSFMPSKVEPANKSKLDNDEDDMAIIKSDSAQSSTSGRGLKRNHNDDQLVERTKTLSSLKTDEFTDFANNIASQLRRVKEGQNLYTQKLISDIIFYARTNSLNRYTTVSNLNPFFTSTATYDVAEEIILSGQEATLSSTPKRRKKGGKYPENNSDDLEQFFAGITATLRSFPIKDKAIAKAKIFEIVSKMEINILSRSSSPVSHTSSDDHGSMPEDPLTDYLKLEIEESK